MGKILNFSAKFAVIFGLAVYLFAKWTGSEEQFTPADALALTMMVFLVNFPLNLIIARFRSRQKPPNGR